MDYQSTRIRTARKPHKCCECHNTIKQCEKYTFTSGVWDGEPASFKTCQNCWEIHAQTSRYVNLTPSECDDYPCFGGLINWFDNRISFDYQDETLVLAMAKAIGVPPQQLATQLLDFTFQNLKANGILDIDGTVQEKQAISSHKSVGQTARYDRKTKIVDSVEGHKK